MELIIIIVALISIFIIKLMMKINIKELEKIALDENLNAIAQKYPQNIEICTYILEMLGNKTTKTEEDKNSETTLYLAINDKILIGNTHESFTRIQTIAHECLHSCQDRTMLMFNFIFSNIYLIYFVLICILRIFKVLPNELMFLNILVILSLVYYAVRIFLENDAMIKARYVAKEYMEEKKISTPNGIEKIVAGFDKINNIGIKCINYNLFLGIMIRILIYNIICIIL